jgi:hypothetical protein
LVDFSAELPNWKSAKRRSRPAFAKMEDMTSPI